MGFTLDSFRKPVYDDDADFVADLQGGVDFAMLFAFATGGTEGARNGLLPGERRDGMIWIETDTGLIWRDVAGNWTLLSPAFLSIRRGVQNITNNTSNDLVFPGETARILGQGLSINLATGVVTASIAGIYRARVQGTWAAGGTAGSHYLMLSKNNAITGLGSALASLDATNVLTSQTVTEDFELAAGDNIRAKAFQASGATKALGVGGASYYTSFSVERLVS